MIIEAEEIKTLKNLAEKVCDAEQEAEDLELKRTKLFGEILDAEDSGATKKNLDLKDRLAALDRDLEISRQRISRKKEKMTDESAKIIKNKIKNIPAAEKKLKDEVDKAMRQLAEYVAGAKVWALALNFSNEAQKIDTLFNVNYGENLPENKEMLKLIKEVEGSIPLPPNFQHKRSDLMMAKTMARDPGIQRSRIERNVRAAIGEARRSR